MRANRRPRSLRALHRASEQSSSQSDSGSPSQSGSANPLDKKELERDLVKNEADLRKVFNKCTDVVFRLFSCTISLNKADYAPSYTPTDSPMHALNPGPAPSAYTAPHQPPGALIAEGAPRLESDVQMLVIYMDGLVDTKRLDNEMLRVLMREKIQEPQAATVTVNWILDTLENHAVPVAQSEVITDLSSVAEGVLKGSVLLLMDGCQQALSLGISGWERRSIDEPPSEPVIRGPREGFIETLRTNTALIRRKIRTSQLKLETLSIGQVTKTDVAIAYIEGIADESIVEEVKTRINRIETDGILESAYIEEFIEDQPFSPFPQVMNTERPDVVAAHLLEGKVAIFTDGTPFVLIVPFVFWSAFNASEDYYQRSFMATFLRSLRILFMLISLLFPSLYVSLATYQQEMIPTNLLLSIAAAQEATPFPAVVETLIMEIVFEALREAGVRMPKQIGQAMSIVGALVIGQAAVQAGIISAPVVIVVSITGIASFTFPRYDIGISLRLLRFPMLIMAGLLGMYGIAIGVFLVVLHLVMLRSFGIPYFSPLAPMTFSDLRDVFIRVPRWSKHQRAILTAQADTVRTPPGQKPSPQQGSNGPRRRPGR